jgi:NADPH2:quinone reductase
VETHGEAAARLQPGDAVYANIAPRYLGGYAEFVAAPHWFVAAKPRTLSFVEAASVPVVSVTALQALRRARPEAGKSLLVAGGSGGVGFWAIQLAKAFGLTEIVTTSGSPASRAYLQEAAGLADARIVDYRGRDRAGLAAAAIAANGGRLFDITLDCVGGAMTHLCCDAVEFEGNVVSVVNGPKDQSHGQAEADEDQLFDRSATFHFEMISALAYYADPARHAVYQERLTEIGELIDAGRVRLPRIIDLGPLSASVVREAHGRLERGHPLGKLVASVG